MSDIKIPVFVCNLLSRIERRQHIIKEFENKQEYSMQIIPAIKNKIGAYGLWLTLLSFTLLHFDLKNKFKI